MIKRESNAVELSTPEEQIAHSVEVRPPRCKRLRTQSFPCKRQSEKAHQLPKNTAACAVMTVMCELGGNRNTMRLLDIKTGSLIPEVSWRWTGGSDGPPASLGPRRRDEGRGWPGKPRAHPNPFPSGLSWNPWHCSLCSCSVPVALHWESPPLPVKRCGLLIILARGHSAFLGLDPLTWQVGNRVLSSFCFPVKSDLNSPGHCANLFLHSPEYPLSPSCIFTYTRT